MSETHDRISAARAAMTETERQPRLLGVLASAALAATAAVLLAGVMILGPGVAIVDPVPSAGIAPL